MTHTATQDHLLSLSAAPRLPAFAVLAVKVAYVVTQWETRRRTRLHLGHLDDALLKDVGMSHRQAHREARLPFWKI